MCLDRKGTQTKVKKTYETKAETQTQEDIKIKSSLR